MSTTRTREAATRLCKLCALLLRHRHGNARYHTACSYTLHVQRMRERRQRRAA